MRLLNQLLTRCWNRLCRGSEFRLVTAPVISKCAWRSRSGFRIALAAVGLGASLLTGPALAATCAPATSGGTAPSDWPSYCWLDFSTYSDSLAMSAGGQAFSFTLSDGSTLTFVLNVTSTDSTALTAVATPSWTGAAFGNTAFLGITGKPVLYTANNASTVTATFSNITLTPPSGITGGATYSFVAADGESTNNGESLAFTTNGANWSVLDKVPPITGSTYPSISNTGTTFTETGAAGTVGAYVVGSNNATTVTTKLVAGGLQGAMFALRYSAISLNKTLSGGRVYSNDQFTYKINATASGTTLGTATSSGTGSGPFGQTSSFITSPQALTLVDTMATGSTSTLANYSPSLTCTNATSGSSTPMPTNAAGASYTFSTIAFGDVIACSFTNTRNPPVLAVTKSAPTPGLQVGSNSVYTLTVTNSGTGPATTAQVKDQLPANLTFVSAVGTNWTCTNASLLITCTFAGGSIAPSGTSTIAVTVSAPVAAAGASDTNYASIDPTGGSSAPTPGTTCTPAASCTSVGPNEVIYVKPVADTGTAVSGTATTAVANVASNDAVNGAAATLGTSGNATVAQSGTWPGGIALNTTTGAITTSTAVQPGTYSVIYQLCDKNTPANCATTTDTITVSASILPVTDSGSAVSGTASTPVANVAANDTVNGAGATLGGSGNATVAQSGTWPGGITLNTTSGAITTTNAVQPGTYSVTYQLCDKNTPANCATVVDTVTVTASILPVADSGTAVSGTASTPIANVASNDTVNGAAATLGGSGNATIAPSGTWPGGIALNTTTGAITTSTAVQPGTYSVIYQLCDKNTPANCATTTDTITVTASILPVTDSGSAVSGTASTPIGNVAANDTVNGAGATLGGSGNATIAQSGTWPGGITLNTTSGAITTTNTVQPGTYSVTYQLCDKNTPANCATAIDTVTVTASIIPVADTGSAVSGTASTPIANVASNDTVNGAAATLGGSGNATVAQSGTWAAGITLNTTSGAITTNNAVQPGTYSVTYQLCDKNTPANCATAVDTITVTANIHPVADTGSAVSGTAATPIANVAANDTVNGAVATLGSSGNATIAQSGSWPAGISLNTTSGAITTTNTVQPGTYSVTYQLCDKNTPANCATVIDTVTVTASIIPVADTGSAVSGTASTPIANVASNDTVNGAAATLGASGNATVAQSGTWATGIALNTTTGAVTTTNAVQPGTYSVTYQLCDKNTPANCATVVDTVTVTASIIPVADTGTAVSGTASTPIANVASNDTVNGAAATLGTSGNATVAQSGTWAAGITLNTSTGAITTTNAVPPGTYSVTYQLCDKNTPANCATVADTVTVTASIIPVADTGTAVSGVASTPIANVASNDTVNGAAATLGTSGNATVAQSGTWAAGITLNTTTGAITTTNAVQPGTYSVTYQLCDKNTPANCATVADTVTVTASIIPVADTGSAVSGTAATPIANVASNDTVNGAAATLGGSGNATVAQSGTWAAGITLNTSSGAITTTNAVPPGTYSVTYQLCDKNTPTNCATVADTVTVTASIIPVADTGSAVSGTASTPIANVASNDTVNGAAATLGTSGNATVAQSGTWAAGISLNTTTGAVTTTNAVPPGTYSVTYQLCDKNTPANCATVADTVTVTASIIPVADTGTAVSGTASTPIANVVSNDTVNGAAATLGGSGNATVAQSGTWPAGISLNTTTGAITTTNAVQPGTYSVTYQLCDKNTPANCATVADTVTVTASIIPVADTGSAVSGTASTPIANVASNDTVNGAAATLGTSGNATVAQSGTWAAGITLNTTSGAIATTNAVPPGTYSVTYQLCDKNTPANCATAADTVTVTANIHPVADAGSAVSGTASTPIANVASNDTVNGAAATLGTSGNATVAQSGTWAAGITLNTSTGAITTTNAVPPGTYSVTYQLCDKNTPANCATVADTVTVTASIIPVADTGTAVSGVASTPIANVASNDTVNGAAATLGTSGNATVAQSGTWAAGITLNTTTGAITTTNAVQPGTYSVTYQLCDKNTPANCATVADTVTVTASIIPVADTGSAVSGTAATPIANVASNDTVNGAAATLGGSGNATVAQSGTWAAGITLNTTSGAITTTNAVQPGTYSVTYQLCDKNTPANCGTVADTVTVTASIIPVADTGTAVSGVASTPIANVASNDTVNGAAATLGGSGNATIAQSGTWSAGITLNTTTGAITTTNAVPPGTYSVTYQLCDKNTPANCATVADTVTVTASIIPVADSGTAVSGTASTPIANVASNDTVNGAAATLGTSGNATVAQSGTWAAGITLNTSSGAITTTNAVPPGTYSVTYQLCDKNTPANCATVVDTVTVTANIHPVADTGSAVSGTASTPIANVAANDTVNGAATTLGTSGNATVAVSGTWPAGIALNTTSGAITTTNSVQPGTYSVTYQLCDKNTPTNCATVADTVTLTASIIPVADTGSAVSGTASTPIANVASNDTVNGAAATLGTSGNATVAQSGTWAAGISLNTTTGAVTTTNAVPPGTYSVTYQLCDKNTPANCATVADTVTVTANIHPVADAGSAVSGTASTPIANVASNDTVNGAAATLGTSSNATVAQSGTWAAGITLNTTSGAITTTNAVQPGTYSVTYQLCDKNTPANCATVVDTVTVTASIIPVADTGTAVSGVASTPIANVASNDTVNGAAATLGGSGNATVAQSGTWPAGISLNTTTGAITTTNAVQPGTYSVTYQLCDKNTPANCATVADTVTVTASIIPVADTGSAVSGTASTPIANVASNDTVNGAAATLGTSGNATVAQSGTWAAGITLNTTSGAIATTNAVPPGTYSVTYQLCDKNTPANCATAADTVTVTANIHPVADAGSAVSGTASTPIANVASNDTVNGAAATLGTSGNATVAQSGTWAAGITLNTSTGAITTTNAVPPGTYSVTYQLCDKNTPANCATVADTVTVTASIIPVADTGTAVSGVASTPIANVASNDTVNGAAATLGTSGNATVAQSGTWAAGITLNTTSGAIATTNAVPPGTYSVTYQLCDKNTPTNCATVADTVTVTASIIPVADSGTAVSGTASTPIANVASNDTVNGAAATLGTSGNATVAQSGTWAAGITLNTSTGAITTTNAVPPGTYSVTYQLCDKNTPTNCATVADTVTVTASIIPVADTGSAVSGTASTPIANVASNDTVNGAAATLGTSGNATVAQSGTWAAGITLNTTSGAITTANAVQPGTYSVTYQLCDKNTPANCATVADTVTVTANIHPVADAGSAVSGTASTPIANVASNDTVNGAAATLGTSGNATVAQSGTWATGIALNTTTGAVTTTNAVAPGTYSVIYQLCDKNTPANCATVADTVTVTASIIPVADSGTAVSGTASTAIADVASNDTVNGAAATLGTSGNATVAQSGTWAAGISLNTTTGAVTTTNAVQPGTYSVTYQLCDKNTPANCATVADTVTVTASIVPVADTGSAVSGIASTPIANVASNDTVNGAAATLGTSGNATVAQSGTWPAGITLNTTSGAITTTNAVAPGTYSVTYQLCDKNTPADCATVADTVTVSASIVPVADTGTASAGIASTPIANVAANDTVNGAAATLGTGGNATVAPSGTWPTGITLNTTTGAITTTAAVTPATYSVVYQLCDKNTPANCATVTDTVSVYGNIHPVADTGTAVSGTASAPIANVAANDTVNGAAATLGTGGNAAVAQSGTWPAGITLNTTSGAITTTNAVQPGTYSVTYQLCDRSTPANCATVADTVTVTASIIPVTDAGTAVSGTASTPIGNVASNDTVNGARGNTGHQRQCHRGAIGHLGRWDHAEHLHRGYHDDQRRAAGNVLRHLPAV